MKRALELIIVPLEGTEEAYGVVFSGINIGRIEKTATSWKSDMSKQSVSVACFVLQQDQHKDMLNWLFFRSVEGK